MHVVIHLERLATGRSDPIGAAVRHAQAVREEWPDAEITIIGTGTGAHMLISNLGWTADALEPLVAAGVDLLACRAGALLGCTDPQPLDGVTLVDSGTVALVRRLEAGALLISCSG